MTALHDRIYLRLEADVTTSVRRRWGWRRDWIDDLVQIGRLALVAEITAGGELDDATLRIQAVARANGDIKNYLNSRAVMDGDVQHVEAKIRRMQSRPRRSRKERTAVIKARIPESQSIKLKQLAVDRGLTMSQMIRDLVRQEISACQ